MSDNVFLDLEDLLSLIRRAGLGPVRDLGLLDSAAARVRASPFGTYAYPTMELKAAALLHSLVSNHALVDGNRRISWLATVVFLDLNGLHPDLSDDEAFILVMDAAQRIGDVSSIASRLHIVSNSSDQDSRV